MPLRIPGPYDSIRQVVHFGLRVAVVVPAYNEAAKIAEVVRRVPDLVDDVIVVDDASHDDTALHAARAACARLTVVRHEANRGVGAAIVTGYRRALAMGADAVVVMAGDGQMDPDDLPAVLAPICTGEADYVKGNRFAHPELWRVMPGWRIVGNVLLSLATKAVSGYWGLFDSQCGYTAINRAALEALHLDGVYTRYGYPNDLLARLHAVGARAVDVPVRPIYGPAWSSGIRPATVIHPIAGVLVRAWARRLVAERRRPAQLDAHEPERAAIAD
jgi:glycosyltransferase involved in cell wall biosynthesis